MDLDFSTPRAAFDALLQVGNVLIDVLTDTSGVLLPTAQMRAAADNGNSLIVEYGLSLPVPIPELHVDEAGIRATLSFNRTPHATFIPWAAVRSVQQRGPQHVVFVLFTARQVASVNAGDAEKPRRRLELVR